MILYIYKNDFMDISLLNRITTNPAILTGKPIVRGMRISVEQIIKMLARGISHQAILEDYPMLDENDIKACLLFAAKKISNEEEIAA